MEIIVKGLIVSVLESLASCLNTIIALEVYIDGEIYDIVDFIHVPMPRLNIETRLIEKCDLSS